MSSPNNQTMPPSTDNGARDQWNQTMEVDEDDITPRPYNNRPNAGTVEDSPTSSTSTPTRSELLRSFTLPSKTPVRAQSYLRSIVETATAANAFIRSPRFTRNSTPHGSNLPSAAATPIRNHSSTHPPLNRLPSDTLQAIDRPPLNHLHAHDHDVATSGSITEQFIQHHPHPTTWAAEVSTTAMVDENELTEEIAIPYELKPHIIIGPVIGKVTTNSARILIEVNMRMRMTAKLTPQSRWFRPKFVKGDTVASHPIASTNTSTASTKRKDEENTSELQSPTKKQKTSLNTAAATATTSNEIAEVLNSPASGPVHQCTLELHPFHPTIFKFTSLQPNTIYLVEFSSEVPHLIHPAELADRTGIFRTMPSDPDQPLSVITFSCDCASEVGRGKENLWEKLYQDYCTSSVPRYDLMLHIGDQVYADSAFAKGELIFGVENTDKKTSVNDPQASDYASLTQTEKCQLVYDAYAEVYRHTWNDSPTRLVLATGSHLMQFDDHEVRNDFGSFAPTPIDLLIAQQARKAFHLYQKQLFDDSVCFASPDEYDQHYNEKAVECSFHTYGSTGVLIMDNRACKAWDETCSLFSKEQMALEESQLSTADVRKDQSNTSPPSTSSSLIPHAHAYFGASQWQSLYKWFRPPIASDSSPTLSSYPTDRLSTLLVVNPSPAFFLGSNECERLIHNTCLLDKLGLGLHPEEQAHYIHLFQTWKADDPERQILFIGGDSHFGMTTTVWQVNESQLDSSQPDPRVVGSGSVKGPGHGPVPSYVGVEPLFQQVLASALSSRRPKYESFQLWKKSLFADHCLRGKSSKDSTTVQPSLPIHPYYLTHSHLLYAHNFVHITCQPSTSSTTSKIEWKYVLSSSHEQEKEVKQKKQAQQSGDSIASFPHNS